MTIQTAYALAVTIWHSVGQLLLGIFVGSYLTKSAQHKQWVLDNKKAEYRELLSTLLENGRIMMSNWAIPNETGITLRSGEQVRAGLQARSDIGKIIEDRLFISKRINKENVGKRWLELSQESDVLKFYLGVTELREDLKKMALDDLSL
jgi:hypothetical protein